MAGNESVFLRVSVSSCEDSAAVRESLNKSRTVATEAFRDELREAR
jgi:hypothetical protein